MTGKRHYLRPMQSDADLKRLHWRAHHRGTREADFMIGGFLDAHGSSWSGAERDWFAALLEEQDVDIMAWALDAAEAPERFRGPMLDALKKLDFLPIPK